MPWFVLTVRMTDHGLPTVCAVHADRCDRGDHNCVWWLGDRVVYTAPTDRVLLASEHHGQIAAQAALRSRQLDLCEKGLQGAEYHGVRPAVGATPPRAAMIERVVSRMAGDEGPNPPQGRLP